MIEQRSSNPRDTLLQRLRSGTFDEYSGDEDLKNEAADEIERLTKILLTDDAAIEEVQAENQRLRAALEHPPILTPHNDWEVVSGNGGPRQRCRVCGWLGLPVDLRPADETSVVQKPLEIPFGVKPVNITTTATAHPHKCKDGNVSYLTYGMTCGNCGFEML